MAARDESKFEDVIAFLDRVEDAKRANMNRRNPISARDAASLREQYPGVPDDYIAYLREVGWGSFRESQFMLYSSLGTPDEILGEGVFDWLSPETHVLCFGDDFSGNLSGFLPDKKWAIVELLHDVQDTYAIEQSFGEYIREKMLMGPNGVDERLRR
jgi:hypothetical protein